MSDIEVTVVDTPKKKRYPGRPRLAPVGVMDAFRSLRRIPEWKLPKWKQDYLDWVKTRTRLEKNIGPQLYELDAITGKWKRKMKIPRELRPASEAEIRHDIELLSLSPLPHKQTLGNAEQNWLRQVRRKWFKEERERARLKQAGT